MKYPKWVPAGVVQMSSAVIQELDRELADLDAKLKTGRLSGRERFNAASRHRQLIEERERVERLTHDPRMGEVYGLLEGFDDEEWRLFFYAALSARVDFQSIRDQVEKARHLSREIAKTAEKLSELIKELEGLRFGVPYEMRSTHALLKRSENSCPVDSHEWRRLRLYLLEQLPESDDDVRHAWESAPCVTDLLNALAGAAKEFKPRPRVAAAAVRTRKRGYRAELIRSFAETLTKYCGFPLTPRLMRAMAITLTVLYIDDPEGDEEVSYEHVREATAGFQPIEWSKNPIPPPTGGGTTDGL
jgi:hypothetical protein